MTVGAAVPASAADTDPGQRSHNEDAALCDDDLGLYVVADGVGGRHAGEVASRLACEVVHREIVAGHTLENAIVAAHAAIRAESESGHGAGTSGMACTAVALHLHDGRFELVWSGDSRAYFWDGRRLLCLTRDHSLVEALVARGDVARRDAGSHPQKNVILSALGGERRAPETGRASGTRPGPGCFLLCSDGLSDVLGAAEICAILSRDAGLAERCRALTESARESGGRDNITAVLVWIGIGAEERDGGDCEALAPYEVFDSHTAESRWPRDRSQPDAPPPVSGGGAAESRVTGDRTDWRRARRLIVALAVLGAAIALALPGGTA